MLSERQLNQAIGLVGEYARRDLVNQDRRVIRETWDSNTPTGLERVKTIQVVKATGRRWNHVQSLTSSWDTLSHPYLQQWWRSTLDLTDKRVFEIGVGEQESEHRHIFMEDFKALSYQAIDRREGVGSDALLQIEAMEDNSIDALACFGILNEPLGLFPFGGTPPQWLTSLPAGLWVWLTDEHANWEYNRRLFREIARVVKPGGIVFGTGLQDGGIDVGGWENAELLEQNGFALTAGYNEFQKDASIQRILRNRLRNYTEQSLTPEEMWDIKLCLGTFVFTKGASGASALIH